MQHLDEIMTAAEELLKNGIIDSLDSYSLVLSGNLEVSADAIYFVSDPYMSEEKIESAFEDAGLSIVAIEKPVFQSGVECWVYVSL